MGFFGLKLFVNLSLFLGNIKSTDDISSSTGNVYLLPPTLNPFYEATNSATIQISGNAVKGGQTIEIYLNGDYKTKAFSDNNGQFTISDFRLENGANRIKARTKDGDKQSAFTQEVTVVFDTTPPALEIKEPTDGQVVKKTPQVRITGKTDVDATILINDFLPIVDSNGNISYTMPLKEGENSIKIVAKDKASNQTTNQLKVIFEP